jgi:rSAM/selenodomain-associated transferase 1
VSGRVLAVFAKPPVPGRVKTRLFGHLSPDQAAGLAAAFLDDLLDRLPVRLAPRGVAVRLAWALAPGEAAPPAPVETFVQEGSDLGARMLSAAQRMASDGALPVVVGADLPDLDEGAVERAFDALERGSDLVLGPASDGGFYLIGFGAAARRPDLFAGVAWGEDGVLGRTCANARTLGLAVELLAEAADVDRPEDLAPLARRLAARGARGDDPCPRTRAVLARFAAPALRPEEAIP